MKDQLIVIIEPAIKRQGIKFNPQNANKKKQGKKT